MLRKAEVEHQKTPAPIAEKRAGVDLPQNVMDNVMENVGDQIDSEIDRRLEEISSITEITANELRELRGTLYAKEEGEERIKALGIEIDHWKKESDKAKTEGAEGKALLYDAMSKAAELKADKIRLKLNQKPVSEEVQSMIEEETDVNDLTMLERFKKWARENIVGMSAIVLSIAGILTAAIMGARNTVKKGGKALGKFAKGISKTRPGVFRIRDAYIKNDFGRQSRTPVVIPKFMGLMFSDSIFRLQRVQKKKKKKINK